MKWLSLSLSLGSARMMCVCVIAAMLMNLWPLFRHRLCCSAIVLEWGPQQCAVDMRYHNFINEIFLWFLNEKNPWLAEHTHATHSGRKKIAQQWIGSNIVQRSHFILQVHVLFLFSFSLVHSFPVTLQINSDFFIFAAFVPCYTHFATYNSNSHQKIVNKHRTISSATNEDTKTKTGITCAISRRDFISLFLLNYTRLHIQCFN